MWFNKRMLRQLTQLVPRNKLINLTKCHPGKGHTTVQLTCYGQPVHISKNSPYLHCRLVICMPKIQEISENLSSRLHHIKKPCQDTGKEPQGICGLFGLPHLINVRRLTWVCRHVNQNLSQFESTLTFKK